MSAHAEKDSESDLGREEMTRARWRRGATPPKPVSRKGIERPESYIRVPTTAPDYSFASDKRAGRHKPSRAGVLHVTKAPAVPPRHSPARQFSADSRNNRKLLRANSLRVNQSNQCQVKRRSWTVSAAYNDESGCGLDSTAMESGHAPA